MAEGLAYRYPSGRVGLDGVSLLARPGQVTGLVGPNGSGKTTLLRLLAGEKAPTAGNLHILGQEADPGPALWRTVGWLRDQPIHLEHLTGEENLEFFLFLSRAGGKKASRRAAELAEAFHLSGSAGVPVGHYSLGMRRKLLATEVLAREPPLLLLDEPTVALDPAGVKTLEREVRRASERGAVVFLATNEVVETPRWCHRIVFLHEGRVAAEGPRTELLRRVRGRTRITVKLSETIPGDTVEEAVVAVSGVHRCWVHGDTTEVESVEGSRLLPELLGTILETGALIRDVRIREPDLSDLFREITGEELASQPKSAGSDGPDSSEGPP